MWILFTQRPSTYQEFERLCRDYGMTMANIRFQEAWAMAHWLARVGLYKIDRTSDLGGVETGQRAKRAPETQATRKDPPAGRGCR